MNQLTRLFILFFVCFRGIFFPHLAFVAVAQPVDYFEKAELMLKTDPSRSIYYANLALVEARKAGD